LKILIGIEASRHVAVEVAFWWRGEKVTASAFGSRRFEFEYHQEGKIINGVAGKCLKITLIFPQSPFKLMQIALEAWHSGLNTAR
jgi:hypothetical protein